MPKESKGGTPMKVPAAPTETPKGPSVNDDTTRKEPAEQQQAPGGRTA